MEPFGLNRGHGTILKKSFKEDCFQLLPHNCRTGRHPRKEQVLSDDLAQIYISVVCMSVLLALYSQWTYYLDGVMLGSRHPLK